MLELKKITGAFPSARIASQSGGLPVEVSLIAQLGHGSGNHLYASVLARQSAHQDFIDELDEPSAKLAGTDFVKGDVTSLYSFAVGAKGHPFHRHAGHRIFTAISGSGGAQLRFSTASPEQIEVDAKNFIKALQYINIPPDCLFTVRFGGETWHQFAPLTENSKHPVFFALSCHTNELGGTLSETLRQQVLNNEASIPSLTELLPEKILRLLELPDFQQTHIPTIALSLDAPPGTLQRTVCDTTRGKLGMVRGAWAAWRRPSGFFSDNGKGLKVVELTGTPIDSLLTNELEKVRLHHDDTFSLTLELNDISNLKADKILSAVLKGFLENPPKGVSRMMAFRNVLVRPMGLRTSSLGCPVSSLLSQRSTSLFDNRYPVLNQHINDSHTRAQVILGANDKHLIFRSCVGVEVINPQRIVVTLGTRVHCKNFFGRFYMAVINRTHRSYVTPTMLRFAVEHALPYISGNSSIRHANNTSITPPDVFGSLSS
ncbi:DUF2867 domain-containing protein [Undibacterium sp. Xuan67W]|uniref:DUF2867 domain-containing protein n=1 Tax=Undibacterium sp. Xuan67W TaxID=3413057 RepID=UPI003BF3B212